MKKSILAVFLRVIVSLGLIVILLYIMRNRYGQILHALRGTDIYLLAIALLVFISTITVSSVRLKLIAEAQGVITITFLESLSLTFIGYFFNNFLPTAIGGDVVKAYYLSKKSVNKISSYTSVFVDRALGLFTMIVMAVIALVFVQNQIIDKMLRLMIYVVALVFLAAVFFVMNKNIARKFSAALSLVKPIEEKLKSAYNAIHAYKDQKIMILKALVISIISQLLYFLTIGIVAHSIGSRIPAMELLLRVPIVCAVSILPSINGLGLREGSIVLLFGTLIGKERAFAVSILLLLLLFVISVIGGIVYALSPQFKVRLRELR